MATRCADGLLVPSRLLAMELLVIVDSLFAISSRVAQGCWWIPSMIENMMNIHETRMSLSVLR